MALNIYGGPISDIAAPKPTVELPQRADGRPCNIYGEPIDDADTIAAKSSSCPLPLCHRQCAAYELTC